MKAIWFVLAWFFFVIGIIGAFLPVIPTTPFLLLSALLFSKSSPRFHKWLLELPLAGPSIKDWQDRRVIRTRAKVLCSVMIFLSLAVIVTSPKIILPVKIIVPLILLSVWSFVITRKSN